MSEKLTQIETARLSKIPFCLYRSFEHGTKVPNVFQALRIAKTLRTIPEDIFMEDRECEGQRRIEMPRKV